MTRWVSLVALIVLAGPAAAAAALPACLATCQGSPDCCAAEPCLRGPCGEYLGCVQDAQDIYDECIGKISEQKKCRSTSGGRCTIILGCVHKCQRTKKIGLKNCRRMALRDLPASCPDCDQKLNAAGQQTLARVCNTACSQPTPTTTSTAVASTSTTSTTNTTGTVATTTTTTSTSTTPPPTFTCERPGIDRCTFECLLRISSLKKNYDDCESKCDGNGCAEIICKENARNIACTAIRARCAGDGDNQDPDFNRCCSPNCPTMDDAPCRILPTTTSTTKLPTTTAPTTTSVTTSTSLPIL